MRFEILGPLRAWHDDQELDLGPGKQRAVLAVLLLHAGRPVSTTRIIDAVWAEAPPANGPNVVQKYVAGLRRVLEPDRSPRTPGQLLALTDAGYLLRVGADEVDALRFEQRIRRAQTARAEHRREEAVGELRAAFGLWRGEPLPGLAGEFFDSARYRLAELRAGALETWAELELQLGHEQELVGELVRLVTQFPLRERLCYLLMLALYRNGRQAEALSAFRDLRTRLRDEHGLEPGETIQELHRRILRSDPTLAAPRPPAAPGTAGRPTSPTQPTSPAQPTSPGEPTSPAQPAVTAEPAEPRPLSQYTQFGHFGPAPYQPPYGESGPAPSLPMPLFAPDARPSPARSWVRHLGTVVGALIAVASFGALTGLVLFVYAAARRNWRHAAAGVAYLLWATVLLIVAGIADPEAEPTPWEMVLVFGQIGSWGVGFIHVVVLNQTVRARLTGRPLGHAAARERRLRREQARHLLHHYPPARTELRLGRPDLPRVFDDGGLIDINAVPDPVIAALPGLSAAQGRHIALDRTLRGPYASLEDLAARCPLPLSVTNELREILLFLPPPALAPAPPQDAVAPPAAAQPPARSAAPTPPTPGTTPTNGFSLFSAPGPPGKQSPGVGGTP